MIQSTCTICKETKYSIYFPINNKKINGVDSHCKECRSRRRTEKAKVNNPEFFKKRDEFFVANISERKCRKCKEIKNIELFGVTNVLKKLRNHDCKLCSSEHAKKRYIEKKEHIKEISKVYYLKNREKRLKKGREREILIKYNMRDHDLAEMRNKSENCCQICELEFSKKVRYNIDHNHVTGAVRGLLCSKCNFAIGALKTDIGVELLQNAIEYIRRTEDYV